MTCARIACITFSLVITSAAASGQPQTVPSDQVPSSTVVERTYTAGNIDPWRNVITRRESGGQEILVETREAPNVEGRMAPIHETVTQTIRPTSGSRQTTRDVFGFAGDGRRRLLETTESRQEIATNGDSSTVHNTWAPDVNGRIGLTSRQTDQTRSVSPDVRQTVTTIFAPHYDEALREIERIASTENRVNPGVMRYDSTHLVRDINGRWQPAETRGGEVRDIGASERLQEETVQRPDMNGKLAIEERTVTRRSTANEREDVVIETYTPYADGRFRTGTALALSERVQRTTTATTDGGRHTVEEVEGRSLAAPGDPMRVIRRIVTTVRPSGGDGWVTERQVFERDVNRRLQLVSVDREETAGR